ncbi:MAG: hypothetical protein HQM03_05740 [Magnetococcales bacterium]|nr:hypothetical protein [Magnetococcales bacterium]
MTGGNKDGRGYTVSMEFETISLPPFRDIMVLARKCPVGMIGLSKCMGLMAPDGFEMVEVEHETVEAILVSKQLIKRLSVLKILEILNEKVFPFISHGEIIRIQFHVKIQYDRIEGSLE